MVRSTEGLSQEDALTSLQSHPSFKSGTKIASVYNQGGRWVAKLLEPKAAAAFEDITETPEELHEEKHQGLDGLDDHEKNESPLEELEEHEDDDSDDKKIAELEKKIDLLLDALGISEKGEDMDSVDGLEGPEGPAADLPAAPAPKGPPKSDPLPPGSGAKLKPGEVPNKPGVTPVGAPSFASVKTASCEGSCDEGSCEHCDKQRKEANSVPPNAGAPVPTGSASPSATGPVTGPCPTCGGAAGSCQCATGTIASFTASKLDPSREMTIRQAKASLENHYVGFRVARIKRDGDYIHALVSR